MHEYIYNNLLRRPNLRMLFFSFSPGSYLINSVPNSFPGIETAITFLISIRD